jgi:hypothetical protein
MSLLGISSVVNFDHMSLSIYISAKIAQQGKEIHSYTLKAISRFCTEFPRLNDGHVT